MFTGDGILTNGHMAFDCLIGELMFEVTSPLERYAEIFKWLKSGTCGTEFGISQYGLDIAAITVHSCLGARLQRCSCFGFQKDQQRCLDQVLTRESVPKAFEG